MRSTSQASRYLHGSHGGRRGHHDNAGMSRKLSAVAASHTMQVNERHYKKVGEDFERLHKGYRRFHPVFVEGVVVY